MTDERITRAEALKRAERRGAVIDERTLDRYRDHGLVTTHRPQERPFVVELDTAEVDALIRALLVIDAEATPTTKRIARIRELMLTELTDNEVDRQIDLQHLEG